MTAKKKPAADATASRAVRLSNAKKTAAAIAANDYASISDKDVAALDAARNAGLLPVSADHEEVALAKLAPTASNTVTSSAMIADLEAELTGARAFIDENASVLTVINAENIALQDKLSFKTGEVLGLEASLSAWQTMLTDAKALHEKDVAALQQEIVDLTGRLRDEESRRIRDVAFMRKDLDAADIAKSEAEAVTRQALADLAAANASVKSMEGNVRAMRNDQAKDDYAVRTKHNAAVDGLRGQLARKQELLENGSLCLSELGSELDAAEIRIEHLERALAHAQRGWIARLFRRPVGGRA